MTPAGSVGCVGILGGGVIGSGWAARFALHGADVRIYDPDPDAARKHDDVLGAARRAMSALLDVTMPREGTTTFVAAPQDAVAGADFVQESAPERLDLKQRLLAAVDAAADPAVVIASSTSGLRPTHMQSVMANPERLVVGHPFNPVYLLPLVEVCGGESTSAATIDCAVDVYRSIGMRPLVLDREIDGFLADRLMEALWREALWLVDDEVATVEQIDDAIRFGAGLRWSAMGTFLTYRLAGGEDGMRHFMAQFGPTLQWPWSKLTDVPELTDELIDRIVDQSDAQAAGRSIGELTELRDAYLVAVIRALRPIGIGAGTVLTEHERALSGRASGADTPQRHVSVTFADGHRADVHNLWLRDNCGCPECTHAQTGERIFDSFAVDPDIAPTLVAADDEALDIEWSDGHRSRFALTWLQEWCPCDTCRTSRRPAVRLWDASIAEQLPELAYGEVLADDDGLLRFLEMVQTTGLAFVRDVPTDEDATRSIARSIGHARETNFGTEFDVRTTIDPNNVAFTAVELGLHTDLANVESPPGIQFLHCLEASAPGGDSTLADGFWAAERIRTSDPDAFRVLCEVSIPYRFHDADHDLRWSAPTIRVDDDGGYREVRFHNALMAPFDLPADQVEATYAALRRFRDVVNSSQAKLTVRLRPGDLMVFHNRRVLHGRTAFDPGQGRRHLFGLYVDVDAWSSRRRRLRAQRAW